MKKQLKPGLLIPIVMITILAACKKSDTLVTTTSSDLSGGNNTAISSSLISAKPAAVTITEVMDFSTNPAFGTFSSTGGLSISGTCMMNFSPNANFTTAHNVITLTTTDGTITIHDECDFAANAAFPLGRGQWQIVGGTGAYANLQGNGAESFPNATNDVLTGIVY